MTITSVTLRGRAAATARMLDACTITRAGTPETFDSTTGAYVPGTDPSTIYTGPCEVQINGLNTRSAEAGGTDITLSRLTVKVPVSAVGIEVNDVVTITASELDPDLVDQEFRVIETFAKSFATARRLQVERLTA